MGSKLTTVDKRHAPSPDAYNIPSKMVEKSGKSFGLKFQSSLVTKGAESQPGPMEYQVDKSKKGDFKFSMGQKLGSAILAGNKT